MLFQADTFSGLPFQAPFQAFRGNALSGCPVGVIIARKPCAEGITAICSGEAMKFSELVRLLEDKMASLSSGRRERFAIMERRVGRG
jgi:hypothetical protein